MNYVDLNHMQKEFALAWLKSALGECNNASGWLKEVDSPHQQLVANAIATLKAATSILEDEIQVAINEAGTDGE